MIKPIHVVTYIFADGIPLIWQSFLTISLIHKIYQSKDVAKGIVIIKPILYTVLTLFFCTMVSYVNNFIQALLEWNNVIPAHNPPFIIVFIPWLLFGLGVCSLYSYLLLEVYYSFVHSQFKMRKQVIRIHIIIIILNILCLILEPILYDKNPTHYAVIVLVNNLMNAIGLSHLVYTFNNGLFQIVLSQQTRNHDRIMSMTSNIQAHYGARTESEHSNVTQLQNQLLKKVTKHGLLCALIISVFFVVVLILALLLAFDAFESEIWIHIFQWIVAPMAINMITLFIWIGISVNDKYYQKWCEKFDKLCLKLCRRYATNKISKKRNSHIAIQETKQEMAETTRVRARPNKSNPMKKFTYVNTPSLQPTINSSQQILGLFTPPLSPINQVNEINNSLQSANIVADSSDDND
eukprot:21009_1